MKTFQYMQEVLANLSNVVKCDRMGVSLFEGKYIFYIESGISTQAVSIEPHTRKGQVLRMMMLNVRQYIDSSLEGL